MDALTKSQLGEIVRTLRANGVIYARLFGSAAAGTLTFDSEEAKADAQYRRVTVIQDDIEYARSSFNAAKDRMFVS